MPLSPYVAEAPAARRQVGCVPSLPLALGLVGAGGAALAAAPASSFASSPFPRRACGCSVVRMAQALGSVKLPPLAPPRSPSASTSTMLRGPSLRVIMTAGPARLGLLLPPIRLPSFPRPPSSVVALATSSPRGKKGSATIAMSRHLSRLPPACARLPPSCRSLSSCPGSSPMMRAGLGPGLPHPPWFRPQQVAPD